MHLLKNIAWHLRCYSSGGEVVLEKKKQLKKLQAGLRRLLKDHNFPFGLDTNPKNIYVKQSFRQNTQQVVPGLGSSGHNSKTANARELYRNASVEWTDQLTESQRDEFRLLAQRNKGVIENWYRAHQGSKLLDDIEAMEKDIADIKRVLGRLESVR